MGRVRLPFLICHRLSLETSQVSPGPVGQECQAMECKSTGVKQATRGRLSWGRCVVGGGAGPNLLPWRPVFSWHSSKASSPGKTELVEHSHLSELASCPETTLVPEGDGLGAGPTCTGIRLLCRLNNGFISHSGRSLQATDFTCDVSVLLLASTWLHQTGLRRFFSSGLCPPKLPMGSLSRETVTSTEARFFPCAQITFLWLDQ